MNLQSIHSAQLISVRWWNATAYYAVILAKILNKTNQKSVICGKKNSPPLLQAQKLGLPVNDSLNLESKNPFTLIHSYKNLVNFVNMEGVQIINAHRPEDHLFGALVKKKHGSVRLVRTVGDVRAPKNNVFNRWLHLMTTDFFIFSSRINRDRYQNVWPIPDDKSAVIYAPVDTDYFKPAQINIDLRKRLGISGEAVVFGVIGRLSPVKDHHTFLKAASKIAHRYSFAEFVISGREEEISRRDLENFSRQLGISEKVHIIDQANDVREIISAIDIGIVSSKGSEAICRVAAEYLAMGKPVILSDVNVLPEMIVPREEGFIFSAGSSEKLAQKMEYFLRNPEHLSRMATNARQRAVEIFSLDRALTDTMRIYLKLV